VADDTAAKPGLGTFVRLYTGTGAFDVVGRRKLWYLLFGMLVLVCIGSIALRGFNLGLDFTGGTQIQFPAAGGAVDAATVSEVYQRATGTEPVVQTAGSGATQTVQIRSQALDQAQLLAAKQALFDAFHPIGSNGAPSKEVISDSAVSGTWGGQITRQALIALGVFLVLVTVFLAFYFERSMAVAALVALVHDVLVTAGVYSLIGFEVSPATVIGLLTILGFSLYDTVVVFDKVKENTDGLLGLSRRTYPEAANLALNQTLMRSINTSLIAVLPVLGLLVIGVGLLGVGTLADLALVQMIGILAGAASSLLLATPILVDLKMRDARFREQAQRVQRRRARIRAGRAEPGSAVALGDEGSTEDTDDAALQGKSPAATGGTAERGTPQRNGTSERNVEPRRQSARSARPSGKARPTGKRSR